MRHLWNHHSQNLRSSNPWIVDLLLQRLFPVSTNSTTSKIAGVCYVIQVWPPDRVLDQSPETVLCEDKPNKKAFCCKCARKPKLFFVSTSSTTTTLQTASLCYATSGAPTGTCTGRKRRSINIEGVPLADVKPSQLNQEVQSSQEDQLDREGRFLLYWITTTSISTSTSFTTTVSISGKVVCTSTGITGLNVCGKWFWYPPPPSARPFTAPLVWIVQTEERPLFDQPKQPMWYTICY